MTRSAHAPEDLRRQSAQEVGHARGVVAGVEDDQDVAVADMPAAHLDQVHDHPVDLGGGDLGDIVVRSETDGIQKLGPRTVRCGRTRGRTNALRWSGPPGGASC